MDTETRKKNDNDFGSQDNELSLEMQQQLEEEAIEEDISVVQDVLMEIGVNVSREEAIKILRQLNKKKQESGDDKKGDTENK